MKVLGLEDFDQHIFPLSLTFHWTRVFSFLTFSAATYLNLTFSFCLLSLFPANLKTLRNTVIHTVYLQICFCDFFILLHLEFFPKNNDQCVLIDWCEIDECRKY